MKNLKKALGVVLTVAMADRLVPENGRRRKCLQ